jgi:hypothetical protein
MDPTDIQRLLQYNQQIAPLEHSYSYYMYFMFVFSSCLTFICLYLFFGILPKLHPELKPIITHTILTSYVMTSTMTLWQFIVLPPYIGGYPVGLIFKTIGPYSFLIGLWICFR